MIKAIITTLDNLPMLKEQIVILQADRLIDEIVVVNNGSVDGTQDWLATQASTVVNRENLGAGSGRNAGLDAAGEFEFILMLDGGIRPLRGGVAVMLAYLNAHPDVDVISPEVAVCYTTDLDRAHRRLGGIDLESTFPQRCLSGTAYALCRARAWDGLRFSEEGPFGEAGWGADDNDMQYRWNEAGIVHHDFAKNDRGEPVQLYRRASGSFGRLYEETSIWPNQFGSVYEQRTVKLRQDYPQYFDPPWHRSEIDVSCVVLGWNEYPMFTRTIQRLHDELAEIPHEMIFVDNGSEDETKWWLDTFALRQHHGNTAVDSETGEILHKGDGEVWTGDVIRVDLPENLGPGGGYNVGFAKARGKYIFYLDGDILPVKGSVVALKEYLDHHDDTDFVGVNAWTCQKEDENPPFDWYESPDPLIPDKPRQGLGNYAYCYSMFRREIWDAGCKLADTGPFASGCGFEEAEFANLMYSKGFRCWLFNDPHYFHDRRDFRRSGMSEEEKWSHLEERRRWLQTKWPGTQFDIVHHAEIPKRHIRRVAVVYKASPDRPGPGGFCLKALQSICNAEQFEPGQEPEGWDDYFYVDNGDFDYFNCPDHCHPSTFWFIDMMTPQQAWRPSLEWNVLRAKTFDRVFAAQRSAVAYFEANGVHAQWLPLAADPDYHRPWDEEKVYDWIALWHNVAERIAYTELARMAFEHHLVAYRDGESYSQWMSRARCSVSLSRSDELIMRVFETMAIGVPLVTDRARDLDALFEEEEHYLGVSSPEELVEKITWVQEHQDEAEEMAERAQKLVLDKHTYYHRVLEVFGKEDRDGTTA